MTDLFTDPAPAHTPDVRGVRDRADVRRQLRFVITTGLVVLLLVVFRLTTDNFDVFYLLEGQRTRDNASKALDGSLVLWIATAVAVVALALAVLNRIPTGWLGAVVWVALGLSFYLAFMVWAFADQALPDSERCALDPGACSAFISNPLPGTVELAIPLVLGAMAGVLCERAGVINIAIEGQLLTGAFFSSVFATFATAKLAFIPLAWCAAFGLVGGGFAGLLIGGLLGFFALRYQVNQVVLGVVLVAFATGLTGFLLGQIPSDKTDTFNAPDRLEDIKIPGLADLPVVGDALFNQTLLVYLAMLAVPAVWFLLYQTKWGLRVRSVGEHPKAADTVGIKVNRVRWQAVLLGSTLAGIGGAYYTVGSTGAFDKDLTAGMGFIALAAVIMGRWHPIGAAGAGVFFAFMLNMRPQLANVDRIPSDLISALPYVATVIAVAGFVGRVRPPAADGVPFVKS